MKKMMARPTAARRAQHGLYSPFIPEKPGSYVVVEYGGPGSRAGNLAINSLSSEEIARLWEKHPAGYVPQRAFHGPLPEAPESFDDFLPLVPVL